MPSNLPEIIFLDLEASSLDADSWPIEIGATWIDETGELVTWSSLIRPHYAWPATAWSHESEAVHGIARADLAHAPAAEDVALEAQFVIGSRLMISDAPEFDTRWLDRLFAAAGLARETPVFDFDAAEMRSFQGDALDALYTSLTRRRAPHRAGPDSRRLARAWLRGKVAAAVDEAGHR